ncbi:MAG TPA: SDR family NAD(P)-dependent oxidoreductase [Candidatus Babeliales bacterium]|nr:SDR family NAD(P)-dependent oxidoreductase [Candidatus Babeliales bacterium]
MSESLRSLEGRLAVVTGANRGIGKSVAEELARNNIIVAGIARGEGVKEVDRMFQASDLEGFGVELDITDTDRIRGRIKDIIKTAGLPISILCNVAGITADGYAIGMKESWDRVIETNLTGTFRVTQAVGVTMLRAAKNEEIMDADIVTIGSIVGDVGEATQVNYGTSKAGLVGMTKGLAVEWPEIRSMLLNPGYVDTDMTTGELSEERIAEILALTNSGIPLTPQSVAEKVREMIQVGKTGDIETFDDGLSKNLLEARARVNLG